MTPEQFDAILADVGAGAPAYRALHDHGSNYRAFYGLLARDPEAREKYARAKLDGMERMADDALEIADDPELEPNDKRVRIDTRKWLLSKLAPKKYGDALALEHSGNVGLTVTRKDESLL